MDPHGNQEIDTSANINMLALFYRFVTNRYLIAGTSQGQDVEWGYCFDVHLNAFFPLLMILHLFQLPLLSGELYKNYFRKVKVLVYSLVLDLAAIPMTLQALITSW